MPWFNVDDGFANSKPVLRIPRRYRCAVIGLWTLAGSWSAKELTDGFVPDHTIEEFASTPAMAGFLVKAGLWREVPGGWQFEGWSKWQKTKDQVLTFRAAEAERKRLARSKPKGGGRSGVSTPDGARTDSGVPPDSMRSPDNHNQHHNHEPLPTNPTTPVGTEPHTAPDPTPAASATRGADLVREHIRGNHPSATLTALRIQASELIKTGTDRDTVAAALQLWNDKPSVGIGRTILASLCSEVIKSASGPSPAGSKSKLRKTVSLANRVRAQENAQLATATRLEIE